MIDFTDNQILALAKEQGLGELTALELDFIRTHLVYDWYALEPQMPYDIAHDRSMAYKALKETSSEERMKAIQIFYNRNSEPE